jgi:lipoprotein-anchoring transpeptidase ErfK/SrfK
MRFDWCVAVACLTVGLAGQGAQAQSQGSARPGAYGGGFIEYMLGSGQEARPAAPAPVRYVSGNRLADAQALDPASRAYGVAPTPRMLHSGDRVPEERFEPSYAPPVAAAPVRTPIRLAALPSAQAVEPAVETIARAPDPRYARQVVAFDGPQRAGTIVVDTPGKFLYLVQPGHQAIRYGIGVGRPGFAWSGLKTISQKREWPDWTPPEEMIRRRPDLPRHMAGGPGNPLGARALYLGSSLYRIHGTNEPHTIGQNVSSGCIRMMNEDVIDLYERTPVGTRVEVL